MLAQLTGLKVLNVATFRPERHAALNIKKMPKRHIGYATLLTIKLPDHVHTLNWLESINVLLAPGWGDSNHGTYNIRLSAPSKHITSLTYHSGLVRYSRTMFSSPGGGWGLAGLADYSNLRELCIHAGYKVELLNNNDPLGIMRRLKSLPQLEVLELRFKIYEPAPDLPEDWPAQLFSLPCENYTGE